MTVDELRPGLWRWTARHPEWTPEEGGPDGWAPEVGCVYYEAPGVVVLIDPLVPEEDAERERFWRALDHDVERLGRPVAILLTTHWHERSAGVIRDRYARHPGAEIWAASSFAADLAVTGVRTFGPGDPLPGDVEALGTSRPGQVVYWIPAYGALVPGDVLLGNGRGGLRVCPDSWLKGPNAPREVREALGALLDRPVEMVLVSHGDPVLDDGRAALATALST